MLDDFGFDEEEEEADHNNRHDETHQHILQAVCTLLFRVGDVLDISSPASKRTMDEYCKVLELQSREKAWPKSLKTLIEQVCPFSFACIMVSHPKPKQTHIPPDSDFEIEWMDPKV